MKKKEINYGQVAEFLQEYFQKNKYSLVVDPPKYGNFGSNMQINILSVTDDPGFFQRWFGFKISQYFKGKKITRWYSKAFTMAPWFFSESGITTIRFKNAKRKNLAIEISEEIKKEYEIEIHVICSWKLNPEDYVDYGPPHSL